jgi:hypothetical protein
VSLVLDSSVTLAWLNSDEVTEAIRRIFEAVAEHGAVVPALWRLEVPNSLSLGVNAPPPSPAALRHTVKPGTKGSPPARRPSGAGRVLGWCHQPSIIDSPMRLGDALVTPKSDATYRLTGVGGSRCSSASLLP